MLGRIGLKKDKKQATKSRLNQPAKTPKKQDVRPAQKKQVIAKPVKKIRQSPNPYQRFLESNKSASIEDLNKYFELRTSRFNSSSIAALAIGLSSFAILLAAYYQGIGQATSINSILLGNVISGIFVGAAITLIVFLGKNIMTMSNSNFD